LPPLHTRKAPPKPFNTGGPLGRRAQTKGPGGPPTVFGAAPRAPPPKAPAKKRPHKNERKELKPLSPPPPPRKPALREIIRFCRM